MTVELSFENFDNQESFHVLCLNRLRFPLGTDDAATISGAVSLWCLTMSDFTPSGPAALAAAVVTAIFESLDTPYCPVIYAGIGILAPLSSTGS
jgi:hypothetical protein